MIVALCQYGVFQVFCLLMKKVSTLWPVFDMQSIMMIYFFVFDDTMWKMYSTS